jgi:hypothetical protein
MDHRHLGHADTGTTSGAGHQREPLGLDEAVDGRLGEEHAGAVKVGFDQQVRPQGHRWTLSGSVPFMHQRLTCRLQAGNHRYGAVIVPRVTAR